MDEGYLIGVEEVSGKGGRNAAGDFRECFLIVSDGGKEYPDWIKIFGKRADAAERRRLFSRWMRVILLEWMRLAEKAVETLRKGFFSSRIIGLGDILRLYGNILLGATARLLGNRHPEPSGSDERFDVLPYRLLVAVAEHVPDIQ